MLPLTHDATLQTSEIGVTATALTLLPAYQLLHCANEHLARVLKLLLIPQLSVSSVS
jgi:hypothetical protein